jgi:hypothetical protein
MNEEVGKRQETIKNWFKNPFSSFPSTFDSTAASIRRESFLLSAGLDISSGRLTRRLVALAPRAEGKKKKKNDVQFQWRWLEYRRMFVE